MGKVIAKFGFRGDHGTVELEALLDSGAGVSVIRRDAAERLSRHMLELHPRALRTVSGDEWMTVREGIYLEVEMKGKYLDGQFYVVDRMPREVIIGVDFMQSWEIRLDPKTHDFTIGVDPEAIEMA